MTRIYFMISRMCYRLERVFRALACWAGNKPLPDYRYKPSLWRCIQREFKGEP